MSAIARDAATDIRVLQDRLDIAANLSRYTYGCDTKDYDLIASAFLPAASIDYDSLPPFEHGFPDFLTSVRQTLAQLKSTQHFVGNLDVSVDGDHAHCTSYVQATHVADNGHMFTGAGRYDDDLIRTPDGWKIAARVFRRQWGRDPDGLAKSLNVGQRTSQ
jgi:ketosteroid isomerase-like protein